MVPGDEKDLGYLLKAMSLDSHIFVASGYALLLVPLTLDRLTSHLGIYTSVISFCCCLMCAAQWIFGF